MGAVLTRIDDADPRSRSALAAEGRLFELYGLATETVHVELPSTKLRVRITVSGSGEPLVMLPGGSGEAFTYTPLIAALQGYRCIAINRPGGGLSDGIDHRTVDLRELAVELLDKAMESVGIDRAALVCNSMGGLWGFWYALRRPERVTALVELGCPALALGTSAPFFMRLIAMPGIGGMISSKLVPPSAAAVVVALRMMGTPAEVTDNLPEALLETAYAMSNLPTYRGTWQTLLGAVATVTGANPRYALTADHLQQVRPRVLLVWGENDPFGGIAKAREAAALIPSASLAVLGRGHLPFLEDPARCAGYIREHLELAGVGDALASTRSDRFA